MKHVESALGRKIADGDHHSVTTLNEVTPHMLGELRQLTTRSQVDSYLAFYVARYRSNDGDKFVRDVVNGGADPKTWGFRNVFLHVEEEDETFCLRLDWAALQARFDATGGDRWWHISPRPAQEVNNNLYWSGWGAIGVRMDNVPYWWRPPRKTMDADCADETRLLVEHVESSSAHLLHRRWLALRMSWWARKYLEEVGANATPEGVLRALGASSEDLCEDAAIALRALVRETALLYDPAQQVRGFVGPDQWYTDRDSGP